MMSLCLLLVLLLAKATILIGRPLPVSGWTPLAFLWQDLLVVLLFAALECTVKRRWLIHSLYAGLVLLVLANIPVMRVLSTPLTAPILRAARGALSDSLRYHATPGNLAAVGIVLLAAVVLPVLFGRARGGRIGSNGRIRKLSSYGRFAGGAAVVIVLLGPLAARRVDTRGLERNPLLALLRTSVPRVQAQPAREDWRTGPFSAVPDKSSVTLDNLADLHGVAAGHNVLLVVLESTAAQYLQPWGAQVDPMPNLTALARRSIVFDNAYSVFPESIKGLVALLSSRFPAFDVEAERHAHVMTPSLASRLNSAGYRSALFHSGRFFYLGMAELLEGTGFSKLEDAGDIGGNHASSFGIDEAATVQRILRWIDEKKEQRFLAVYLPIAGHHPYESALPGPFATDTELNRYRNALHEGDLALGQLLDGLQRRGLADSTVVVVVGDHGEAFGQHPGNYGHNLALYEENVRVPLLIALPNASSARRSQQIASVIDLAPTTLDLLGVTVPPTFQGSSLLTADSRMALFFTDYSLGLLGLRDGCYKFVHELESQRSRIFDVCKDALETRDLSGQLPDRVTWYRARLRQWSAAQVALITQ